MFVVPIMEFEVKLFGVDEFILNPFLFVWSAKGEGAAGEFLLLSRIEFNCLLDLRFNMFRVLLLGDSQNLRSNLDNVFCEELL